MKNGNLRLSGLWSLKFYKCYLEKYIYSFLDVNCVPHHVFSFLFSSQYCHLEEWNGADFVESGGLEPWNVEIILKEKTPCRY